MSQRNSSTSRLLSLDTARAEFQAVVTHGNVVLDVQTRHFASDGREQRQYALADLSLKDAARLRNLLNEAIAASQDVDDPRQTSFWSDASVAAVGGNCSPPSRKHRNHIYQRVKHPGRQ
ncbi:MAG: hypothetical protein ACJ8AI_06355 [Rhodopila sp.]